MYEIGEVIRIVIATALMIFAGALFVVTVRSVAVDLFALRLLKQLEREGEERIATMMDIYSKTLEEMWEKYEQQERDDNGCV